MSDFTTALTRTLGYEGEYDHDPDDPGGETYRGISRRYQPKWEGWARIDQWQAAGRPGGVGRLAADADLQARVAHFYRERFWKPIGGEQTPAPLAGELFDLAVNLGVNRATLLLQQALNLLNRQGTLAAELSEDGRWGPATQQALAKVWATDAAALRLLLALLRGGHYVNLARSRPVNEKFLRGWLKRVPVALAER